MRILSINSGSSSIKASLYEFFQLPEKAPKPLWQAHIEWKGVSREIEGLTKKLPDSPVDCIGHRIVHGGAIYQKSTPIGNDVKKDIRDLAELAPLHNQLDLAAIELLEKRFPGVPQIAVFDTAFHHTLPNFASTYPIPYEWTCQGIRRFGFHGINFQYCTRRAGELLGKDPGKMVICHLGSGASLCAIQEGKSVDTTMGFTPLEGLMMDTRSGSIDPGILLHLLEKGKKTLSSDLYEKSGLLGVSGLSSDMRDILRSQENPRCKLALQIYLHRLLSSIGSMVFSLNGLDTLVFTGGIGENAKEVQEEVKKRLSFLGKIQFLIIPAEEAFEIARECWKLCRV